MHRNAARIGSALLGWRLIRNFGAVTISQVISRGIRFFYLIAVARFLGPESVGVYIYGFGAALVLLGLAGFGQEAYLSTRLGKNQDGLSRVVSHSLTVIVVMAALCTIIGLGFVWATEQETGVALAVSLFVLAIVPRAMVLWVRHCYIALEQAEWIPRYEIAFRGGEAMAGTAALFSGAGLLIICAIHFLFWALEAALALRRLARLAGLSLTLGRNARLLKGILRASFYFMASLSLLNLFSQIGVLGLHVLQPDAVVVGYFGIANQILMVFLLIPLMFGQVFLPSLSRGYHSIGTAPVSLTFAVKVFWLAGGLLAIMAQSYGAWVITTLFGAQFAAAGAVFATISWVLGPYAVTILLVQALNGLGGRGLATIVALAMVVVHLALLAALVPSGALAAAQTALLIAASLGVLLSVACVQLRLGLKDHGWWLHPMIAVAVPGAVTSLGAVPHAWAAPVGGVIFVLLVWQLKVFREVDLDLIRGRFQALAGRGRSGAGRVPH